MSGGPAGSLAALAAAVRDGRVSAVALVRRSLERIEAARALNAVIALRAEVALDEAAALDRRLAEARSNGTEVDLPLAGLPLLVKETEHCLGLPTTYGSRLFADARAADRWGLVPGRLVATGAIAVGKTNVPEFALEGYTANDLFGVTRNPWAPEWSPGGSSGGSGAAVAAGLAPLATATDVGGSIRIPASLCGLVGLKPTGGLIGRDPDLPTLDLNNHGPLATSAADARLLLGVLAGPTPGDPFAPPLRPIGPGGPPSRVLATHRLTGWPADMARALPDAVESRFATALEAVERDVAGGLAVERIAPAAILPDGVDPEDWFRIVAIEQLEALGGRERLGRDGALLSPSARGTFEAALEVAPSDYHAARRRRYAYTRHLDEALGEDTILLTPTLTVEGWSADGRLPGEDEPGPPSWVYAVEVANFGGHPAVSLPAGRFDNGVPFGLQVIAPRHRDDLLLWFAAAWEAARPWPLVAAGYQPFEAGLF
ncbi:MAG TPA: amidase [Candidatus Limnocylindrales bacterium]|nr:amidase [Candidatus Limnocylindrales bacterium]